jgi:hypothetical protein
MRFISALLSVPGVQFKVDILPVPEALAQNATPAKSGAMDLSLVSPAPIVNSMTKFAAFG